MGSRGSRQSAYPRSPRSQERRHYHHRCRCGQARRRRHHPHPQSQGYRHHLVNVEINRW